MAQHLEQTSAVNASEPRAQRMTAAESRAVIELWQQEQVEQTGLTDKPAVPDVAEGLDITVEDVQRLLQDVRAKRIEEQRALAAEQELSEIRLAEEERKRAEVRRQRAELDRQRAERLREHSTYSEQALSHPMHASPGTRRLLPSSQDDLRPAGFAAIGIVICLGLLLSPVVLRYHRPQGIPSETYTSDAVCGGPNATATYDAQGKVKAVSVTCTDCNGRTITCSSGIIDAETDRLQRIHDQKVAADTANAIKEKHVK